jgi:hypothetical protein
VPAGFHPSVLEGRFKLVVVATVAKTTDTVVSGLLSLWRTPDSLRSIQPAAVIGATDLEFSRLGRLNTAYSPASRDGEQPGVQLSYDGKRASLVVGAGTTTHHRSADAGLLFYIQEVGPAGFRGRWLEGSPSSRPAQGYFCAARSPHS